MKVTFEQLWGSTYQPWLADSSPWNTVAFDKNITTNDIPPTIKYGTKILANVESIVISNITPTIKWGIKILVESVSVVVSTIAPRRIGSLWRLIAKIITSYTNINKPTTIYTNIDKPTTSYNNIDKPIL
jgi:hypothetical protein